MIQPTCYITRTYIWHGFRSIAPRKRLALSASVNVGPKSVSFSSKGQGGAHDDLPLRQVFDSQSFWQDFSHTSVSEVARSHRGLFQNNFLTKPKGFLRYAEFTQARCQQIVEDVLSAASFETYVSIPRKLDLLSDSLCRLLDIADFVRSTHPDVHFQDAATRAYASVFEYMNVLNTTPGLDAQLRKALTTPEVSRVWSEEEKTVVQILLKDFAQSAIRLPEDQRRRFVELSNQAKRLGGEFGQHMTPQASRINLERSQLKGMDPLLLAKLSNVHGKFSLPTLGDISYAALGSVQDERTRREIYTAGRQSSIAQIQRLENLLWTRAEIAKLSSYKSYAHMSLSDKMAKSPEAVNSFLKALSVDNGSVAGFEVRRMTELKAQECRSSVLQPWDVVYYRNRLNSNIQPKFRKPDFMAAYFSLGTVIQGLSRLFDRLYGIHFVPTEPTLGETWHRDVRRLNVIHETEGHVAILYCDLFARAGKTPNPTHFTLRCSRLISSPELDRANGSPEEANDGMAVFHERYEEKCYQIPVIALVCNFPHPTDPHSPTLLTFQDVRTLFHEMGHAIHSILGRTSLQIVSGTRCSTDFAELPSVLMEYFASDASVLALFARHWETDAPLPYQMVEDALQMYRRGRGLQTETQILFSLLDQAYHSSLPLIMGNQFDSTKVFFDIHDKYGSLVEPRRTSAQGLFGHLVEYGGTYYSYLFDRAIAGKLWKEVFRNGAGGAAIDRKAGELYKEEVLKWGGSRSGWACISGVLGDERLKDGGREVVEEVGRWGVHE